MSRVRSLLLFLVFLPVIAFSQPLTPKPDWLEPMRLGGYVIVLRHGQTTSDNTDPMANPAKNADPMSKPAKKGAGERQLSEQGRAQARSIGEAMHELRIPVSVVMTSPLQRAIDTGTLLGYGQATTNPDLAEAGSALAPVENNRRAEAMRKIVSQHPPADNNLVIVSHKPNIVDAFGKNWSDVHEGEASVFQPDGSGGYKLFVRIQADEWNGLVQSAN